MRDERSAWLRLASLVYRTCSRLTPRRFRERFGSESEEAFQHLLEDTLKRRGSGAAITTAAAACGDMARAGVVEQVSSARSTLLSGARTDVRQALRIYTREPILAGAIALTLALVAGPAVAIFSVLYQWVLAPLPYPDAGRLVAVVHRTQDGVSPYLTAAGVQDYRNVQAFASVGGIRRLSYTMVLRGQPERVDTYQTTVGLLPSLGVPFVVGRDLQRGEPGIVVTRSFAISRFGGESAALGQSLMLGVQQVSIVGVLAYRPVLPGQPGTDLFVPHPTADVSDPNRQSAGTFVIARLRPDADVQVAVQQARAVAADVHARFPGRRFNVTPELQPLAQTVSGSLRAPLLALSGVMALVFLIAVGSLASLVLARAAARSADVAVRTALGASRWQLTRAWLIDGVVLALPGMAAGVWLGDALERYGRTALPAGMVPVPEETALGASLVVALGLSVVTAALFALSPILAGLLRSASVTLRHAGGAVAGLRRVRFQALLIVSQVALSIVLVTTAAWLSASLWQLFSRPLGFDAEHLVTVYTQSVRPREAQTDLVRRALARLDQLRPGVVDGVAVSTVLPGAGANTYGPLRIRADWPTPSEDDRPSIARSPISTNYLQTLGVPLIRGRYFSAGDEAVPDRVIIVSRSFAAKWFPEGALGQVVAFGKDDRREIVGVVEDVHAGRLDQDSKPQAYVPLNDPSIGIAQSYVYVLRTARPARAIRADLTAIVHDVDSSASVMVVDAAEAMAVPLAAQSVSSRLIVAFALVALLLAIVNVYALSAFTVVQRTRELGIRMALGAETGEAVRTIMRKGLAWVSVGLVLGGGAAMFLVAPVIQNQLFDTRTSDLRFIGLALIVVGCASVLASWLPARRAARIDPAITLRAE